MANLPTMPAPDEPTPPPTLWDRIFGRELANWEEDEQKVGVLSGIPMLGLDGLSSAAYGPEAALTLLIPLGLAGVGAILPIIGLIVTLLIIVYFSYRQTIAAYPQGGGSYTVAKENLGVFWGRLAAAALLLDYILTVAVGISAGVGALVSAAPKLHPYTLPLCLVILAAITLINLRGVREAGVAFMVPTYLFLASLLAVLGIGVFKAITSGGHPQPVAAPPKLPLAAEAVSVWLLVRAFASGCTAMTGVEAVSNGITAFREPKVDYARRTLTAIIGLLAVLLLGVAFLSRAYGIGATNPDDPNYESVLSQITAAVVGKGVFYYVTIGSVLAVLTMSANTAFAGFPRLCSTIAEDDALPHGFAHKGRRLVYSQGILVLAALAALLLIGFGGITDRLIPLYAVGAFLAFTLSQAGMVGHWLRTKDGKGWQVSMAVNGFGAVCTGITLVVVLVSKFVEGAWITVLLVPALLTMFYWVDRHYRSIYGQIQCKEPIRVESPGPPIVLLPIRNWTRIARKAVRFGLDISPDVHVLHISENEEEGKKLQGDWARLVEESAKALDRPPPRLIVVPSPYRQLYRPLINAVKELSNEHPGRRIAVIIPELVEPHWWDYFLHNQVATILKTYLLFSGVRSLVIIDVPWYLSE